MAAENSRASALLARTNTMGAAATAAVTSLVAIDETNAQELRAAGALTMSKATFTLGALAGAIGIAGVVLGSVALAKVQSSTPVAAPSAGTATATPESDAVSGSDVHAAAVEACAAADTFRGAVGAVRQPYVDAAKVEC